MESSPSPLILLTGPKHSGKTSVGRALARLIRAQFIDLDELIEARTGKSPRALYQEGPLIFKTAEAEALEYLLSPPVQADSPAIRVAAAGGGLIDNQRAMDLLQLPSRNLKGPEQVLQIYLEITAETAWKRIRRDARKTGELPPFLGVEDPCGVHAALHTRRARAYREASAIILDAEGRSAVGIAREIRLRLSGLLS
jgi:shikimate kinase